MTHAQAVVRAKQVVARMTLDEKIAQVHGFRDANDYRVVAECAARYSRISRHQWTRGVGPGGAGSQKPATALPAPIALAASWDSGTVGAPMAACGEASETRALGSALLEAPDINIARVPQGGRVFESYGEDPYLVSRMAVAQIEGLRSTGVLANVKHYAANNQETRRGSINEIVDGRTLRLDLPARIRSVCQRGACRLNHRAIRN